MVSQAPTTLVILTTFINDLNPGWIEHFSQWQILKPNTEDFNMSKNAELFNTPMLRYLHMKETFLERFMKKEGEFWSKEHIITLDGIIEYFHETSELANEFPQQLDFVVIDNKNLVFHHVLPLPPKLYEQLLFGVGSNQTM